MNVKLLRPTWILRTVLIATPLLFSRFALCQADKPASPPKPAIAAQPNSDVETLKKRFANEQELIIIRRNNCRTIEKLSRFQRRKESGRVREFVYDFNLGRFQCPPSKELANCGCDDIHGNCEPPFEISEMDGVRLRFDNVNPFLYTVNLYELQGDQISNENLTQSNWNKNIQIGFTVLKGINIVNNGLAPASVPIQGLLECINVDLQKLALLEPESFLQSKLQDTVLVKARSNPESEGAKLFLKYEADLKTIQAIKADISTTQADIARRLRATKELDDFEGVLADNLKRMQNNIQLINQMVDLHNQLIYIIHSPINNWRQLKDAMVKNVALLTGPNLQVSATYTNLKMAIGKDLLESNDLLLRLGALDDKNVADKVTGYVPRKDLYGLVKNKLDNFQTTYADFNGTQMVAQIDFMMNMVRFENFSLSYETHSLASNADFVRYRVEFKPNVLDNNIPQGAAPANVDITFQIRQGWKFDVSSGFVMDIGLNDPSFYFDKTTDPTGQNVFVRQNGDNGKVTPSIAAFLNGYIRASANVKGGGAFGIGLSNNGRFRLYLGPSMILGRSERIVLTGGVSFGAISRLADGYSVDQSLANNASLPSGVPTVLDKYQFGGYFGIGFNLTGTKNKSFLQNLKFN